MFKSNRLLDKTFLKFVEGKTIAVVGPSKSIIGNGKGSYIDLQDIVVRFSYMFPLSGDLKKDVGEKTDFLYHCFGKRNESEKQAINKLYNLDNVKNLKCIVTKENLWAGPPDANHIRNDVIKSNNLPNYIIPYKYVLSLKKKYKIDSPNLGLVALDHLLALNPKSLYLTGFTVHKDGYYKGYNDNHPNFWINGKIPDNIGCHNIEQQRLMLKSLYNKNKKIMLIDDNLNKILSI